MSRKKEALTLSVPPGTKEQLEAIARRLNILWGKEPSVSGLIVAIAQQQFEVGQPFRFDTSAVQALQQAIKVLLDSGDIGEAQTLLALLLDRGNLEAPLRLSLLQQISQPSEAWRRVLDRQIANREPFRLIYRNAQGQELEFTVRCAKIQFYEKRFYVEIWCDQTEDSGDLPELIHNRCLRMDRVLAILPASGIWRESLDYVEVQLHFKRGLVKAYEAKPEDIHNEVVGDVRHAIRRVSNTFWFIRDVRRYGADCVVVSPQSVRDRIKQELISACQEYNLTVTDPTSGEV